MIGCPIVLLKLRDPTLGFMQNLEHLKFLEYLLGLNMKELGMQMAKDQVLTSSKV